MRQIRLTNGGVALVDDEDFDRINQHSWWSVKNSENCYYAARHDPKSPKRSLIRMHRFILNAKQGQVIDHKDGDGLNNCRSNLRICSQKQNCLNRRTRVDSKSGVKGVKRFICNGNDSGKWIARIQAPFGRKYLGLFDTIEDARNAYNSAALKYHGEFARLT